MHAADQVLDREVKAQGDPVEQREYAVLCCQRVEILKPIPEAMK